MNVEAFLEIVAYSHNILTQPITLQIIRNKGWWDGKDVHN